MSNPESVQSGGEQPDQLLGESVDWAVTLLLVAVGVVIGLVGILVSGATNRAELARLVAEGRIQSETLSNAELVDVTYALAWWGGLGLAVTGAALVVGGVGFLAYRRRTRRRRLEHGVTGPDTMTNALVGAVISIVASFVPFSPILGGAVAGYLQRSERLAGVKVGAFSGLVATAPLIVLFVFVGGGLAIASSGLGTTLGVGVVLLALLVALVSAVTYTVVLSAIGGYLGVFVYEERTETV